MAFSRLSLPLGIFLAFSQIAAALNLTFIGKDCIDDRDKIFTKTAYFNATGTTKFNVEKLGSNAEEPWYYSVTLMDERGSIEGPFINRWLSVPKTFWGSQSAHSPGNPDPTSICIYTLQGFEKAMKSDEENNTCQGVVRDKCIKAYDELDSISDRCPSVNAKDGCGHTGIISTGKSFIPTRHSTVITVRHLYSCIMPTFTPSAKPIRFTKDICHLTSVPGLDIPKHYITIEIVSVGYESDKNSTVYDQYDKALRQPIPAFFVFAAGGIEKQFSQSVCAIPNEVKRDSRTVEDGKKDGFEEYENGTDGDDDGDEGGGDGDGDGGSQGVTLGSGQPAVVAILTACLISATLF